MTTSTTDPQPEPLLDIQRLVVGIRWRHRMWISIALLGLILGAAVAAFMPPEPTAETKLLVARANDQPSAGEALMRTDVAVLESTRVAEAALDRLGSQERPEAFLADYEGIGVTGNILEIKVDASSDDEAVRRAQALADAFIADHVERVRTTAQAQVDGLTERRTQLETQLASVGAAIAGGAIGTQRDSLSTRRTDLLAQIADLQARADRALDVLPPVLAGTQIVDAPRAETGSRTAAGVVSTAVGLVLGLAVGIGLAAVAAVVRDRPVLRSEISEHLGASVIAQLPQPRRGPAWLPGRARTAANHRRIARTLVRGLHLDTGAISILELGCPAATAQLALDIAEELAIDGPVVLIDDLPGRDLQQLVARTTSPIRIIDATASRVGSEPPDGSEHRLGVSSVDAGVAWIGLPDLGTETLLVLRAGYASTDWLHTVARQLADAGIVVIGVVLVHPDPRDRSDGTLWTGLHTALRGRASHQMGSPRLTTDPLSPLGSDSVDNLERP